MTSKDQILERMRLALDIDNKEARAIYNKENKFVNYNIDYSELIVNGGDQVYGDINEYSSDVLTPKEFAKLCATKVDFLEHYNSTHEDSEKYLSELIEKGIDIETAKRQIYKEMKFLLTENKDDPMSIDYARKLRKAIKFIDDQEINSPYYDLKDMTKQIRNLENQKARDIKNSAKYNKKISALEGFIAEFMDTCEKNGLDREIAEEYLASAKINIQIQEAETRVRNASNEKNANKVVDKPVSDNAPSTPATKSYERKQKTSHNYSGIENINNIFRQKTQQNLDDADFVQEIVPKPEVKPVEKEEIEEVRGKEERDSYDMKVTEEYKADLKRQEESRRRHRDLEQQEERKNQGFSRCR